MTNSASNGPRMARAVQLTKNNKLHADILAYVSRPSARQKMMRASDQGQQALAAVADDLHAVFGDTLGDRFTKVYVGTAIAGVLEEEGFAVLSKGDRMPPNLPGFQTAARYVRQQTEAPAGTTPAVTPEAGGGHEDILVTMLTALSADQSRRLMALINGRAAG